MLTKENKQAGLSLDPFSQSINNLFDRLGWSFKKCHL